jgi:phosphatidylserine/phosphatidylglycerophosphate/cardiolipin synthase-like enzyme
LQTQAWFDDIQLHILRELKRASSSIHIAVAWFTDPEIFAVLCDKAKAGVRVELVIFNDAINRKSNIDFDELTALGGLFLMVGDKKRNSTVMHNKFCVIDASTVITGSYNWSRQAQSNDENVTVISDHPELARQLPVSSIKMTLRRSPGMNLMVGKFSGFSSKNASTRK